MRGLQLKLVVAAVLAQDALAAAAVCSTGIYALLSPLKNDANARAFCAAKYKPKAVTTTVKTTTTPKTTETVLTTTTIPVTSTVTDTSTVTVTVPFPAARRAKRAPQTNAAAANARTGTTPTPAAVKLLSSLSSAVASVVTTFCSCNFGGPATVTVTSTLGAPTSTIKTTSVITEGPVVLSTVSTTVTVTTTSAAPPADPCPCATFNQNCGPAPNTFQRCLNRAGGTALFCANFDSCGFRFGEIGDCRTDDDCDQFGNTNPIYRSYCLYNGGCNFCGTITEGCTLPQ